MKTILYIILKQFQKTKVFILLLISMQNIADFVIAAINNYRIDCSTIQRVQALLNEKWKVDGWISLILSNEE